MTHVRSEHCDGGPTKPPVAIIGFGGHGRVCLDALKASGRAVPLAADWNWDDPTRQRPGIELVSGDELLRRFSPCDIELVAGVGSIDVVDETSPRRRLIERLEESGYRFTGFRHPSAWISPVADVASTAQIHAGVVVQSGAIVRDFTILNTGALVDHDCLIESCCHLAPGVTLSGDVTIGSGSHIGTGANVIQGINLGSHCFIAAGATVIGNVAAGQRMRGTPARPFER